MPRFPAEATSTAPPSYATPIARSMISKLEGARIAQAAGAHLAIVSGHQERPLTAFAAGGRGTVFVAEKGASARKAWLAGRLTAKGRIHVDAGAEKALGSGRSLLAAGAIRVEGRFARREEKKPVARPQSPPELSVAS